MFRSPARHARTSALLLVAGSAAMLLGFILHPAESASDTKVTAHSIADHQGTWATAHWLLAGGGILLASACILLARARYGPTRFTSGQAAWFALAASALLALEIFVVEATLAVARGRANDTAGLDALLPIELPGIVGLFGLSGCGAWVFFLQARDACPVLPRAVNWIALLGAVAGFAGSVAFGLGNDAWANLQYGNGVLILGLAALGLKALRESSAGRTTAGAQGA